MEKAGDRFGGFTFPNGMKSVRRTLMKSYWAVMVPLLVGSCAQKSGVVSDESSMMDSVVLQQVVESSVPDSSIYGLMDQIPLEEIQKAKAFCGKISAKPRTYGIAVDTGFVVEYLIIKKDKKKIEFEAKAKKYFSSIKEWENYPNLLYDGVFDFCVFSRYKIDTLSIGMDKNQLPFTGVSYFSNLSYKIDSTGTFLLMYFDEKEMLRAYRIGRYGKQWLSEHFQEIIIDFEKEAYTHVNKESLPMQEYRGCIGSNRITMEDFWSIPFSYTSGTCNKPKRLTDILPWSNKWGYNAYYLIPTDSDFANSATVISRYRDWEKEKDANTQEVIEIVVNERDSLFRFPMIPIKVGDRIGELDASLEEVLTIGNIHYYHGNEITLEVKEKDGVIRAFRYYYGIIDEEALKRSDF